MLVLLFLQALFASLALAGAVGPPSLHNPAILRTRNAPGRSNADTYHAIGRALSLAGRDTTEEGSVSLDKSWVDTVLFSYSRETAVGADGSSVNSVTVTCISCYIKGEATARFSVEGDFNTSQAFDSFTDDVGNKISSLGEQVVEYIDQYVSDVATSLDDGIDIDDFELPTMDFEFNVDLPEIPECRLEFNFDGLELYMLIDTVLSSSSTYTLNLYTSNTPIGFAVRDDLQIGVTLSIDLILSVDGEIDISTGIHIKLDDGVAIDIAMFSKDVSSITMNGGKFEFLPVTVESAGIVFKAVLRVGMQAGFEISSPGVSVAGIDVVEASAGVEVGVYANVAEFTTNVTFSADDEECELRIAESYQLALGAHAGASVAIESHTWGPVPETEIPIFYTTLAEACAGQKSSPAAEAAAAVTSPGVLKARAGGDEELTTTTISTEVTYLGVACMSEGLVHCPASLQTTTKFTTMKTHVTAVPSDVEAEFPETTKSTVASTIPFGDGAKDLLAVSGSPVSYVPPPPTSPGSGEEGFFDTETGGVPNRVIIGVSVGLGVPVLVGAITGVVFLLRRRGRALAPTEAVTTTSSGSLPSAGKPDVGVSVTHN